MQDSDDKIENQSWQIPTRDKVVQGNMERVFVMKKNEVEKVEEQFVQEKCDQRREKKLQKGREYHAKNKERLNAQRRLSYAENRTIIIAKNNAYRLRNQERINQRRREYYQKNREHLERTTKRTKSAYVQNSGNITPKIDTSGAVILWIAIA